MNELLFDIVILLANIVQGITGFAGTILAMPFSIMLVGYEVAKPVLNVLGLLSGIYVFLGNKEHVNWKEFRKIVLIMAIGIFTGMGIKYLLTGQEVVLYKALGVFVVCLATKGLYSSFIANKKKNKEVYKDNYSNINKAKGNNKSKDKDNDKDNNDGKVKTYNNQNFEIIEKSSKFSNMLLILAGVVHGIFVSGGPLLIGYLTKKIKDKDAFRATISTVWIMLNTIIMVSDISNGLWSLQLVRTQLITVPFLFAGMFIGGKLYKIMSQNFFMVLTYVLLFISGITLLIK